MMPKEEKVKARKRMIVEEVSETVAPSSDGGEIGSGVMEHNTKPQISENTDQETDVKASQIDSAKQTFFGANNAEPIKDSSSLKPKHFFSPVFWILVPGIFLLGAILGGIVFYQKGVNSGQEISPSPSATQKTSSTTLPSATPSASPDLTKYTIALYNGSGLAGEAGKVKTLLTSAGFKVGSTANAASYDYTKTIIKAKSTVSSDFVSALSSALSKTYVVDAAQTLSDSSADTVQVVVGTSKAE